MIRGGPHGISSSVGTSCRASGFCALRSGAYGVLVLSEAQKV